MRITNLKLVNFGRHKNLELKDLDSSVIGVVGANGNGKSTVLQAIEFAFKGKLDSAINSFISLGETYGSVELDFTKNGIQGHIYRRFGKSSSTKLKWGNEELTRASDISKKLDEILEVDKQVIDNTIFIKQGEMLDIIQSTPAKRIELFNKLLNLGYIGKRYEIVDAKYKSLKASIADPKSLEDALATDEESLAKMQQEYFAALNECNRLFVSESNITKLDSNISDYNYFNSNITADRQILESKNASLEKLIAERTVIEDELSSLESNIAAKKRATNDVFAEQVQLTKEAERIDVLKRIQNACMDFYRKENLPGTPLQTVKLELGKASIINTAKDAYDDAIKLVALLLSKYPKDKEQFDKCERDTEDALTSVNTAKLELSAFENIEHNLNQALSVKKVLKEKLSKKDSVKCPVCGLELILGQSINSEDIASLEAAIANAGAMKLVRQSNLESAQFLYNLKSREMINLSARLVNYQETFLSCTQKIIYNHYYNFKSRRHYTDKSKLLQDAFIGKRLFLKNITTNLLALNKIGMPYLSETELVHKTLDNRIKLSNINKDYDALANSRKIKTDALAVINQDINIIEGANKRISNMETKIKELKLADSLNTLAENEPRFLEYSLDRVKNELLKEAFEKYNSIRAQQKAIDFIKVSIAEKQNAIKQLRQDNLNTYDILADLSDIAEGLNPKSDTAIPRQYVRYLFRRITEVVKTSLALMETDFIVEMDESEDVAFKFKRTYELDKDWMHMSKLSGGQKVRLAVVTLLAIQQIICPELGFIVLDEPSTHLDTDGVNALSEILLNIDNSLKSATNQIWFVDHNIALEKCCSKKINL